jgi:hypothetical protein
MSEVTPENEAVAKKPISEKQRLANIANSRLSTGPRTDAGKDICKYNGLRHGLRAETLLPGEREVYEFRMATWSDDWGVHAESQQYLVHRAVMASLKQDRGDCVEGAVTSKLADSVVEGADARAAGELDRLIALLASEPGAAVRQLRKLPRGCLWIREQLLIFKMRLEKHCGLLYSQRLLSIRLLGKTMHDVYRDDPVVIRWVVAHLGSMHGDKPELAPEVIFRSLGTPVPPMSQVELDIRARELIEMIPGQQQSNILLRGYVAEELARLDEQIELVNALAERDLARDVDHAMIALNPEGKQLLGYVTAQRQSYDAARRQLVSMQNPRQPRPGRGPSPGAGPEKSPDRTGPAAATVAEPTTSPSVAMAPEGSGVGAWGLGLGDSGLGSATTEIQVAVATEAASRDRDSLVEATAGLHPMTEVEVTDAPMVEPESRSETTRPISAAAPSIEVESRSETTRPISAAAPMRELVSGRETTGPRSGGAPRIGSEPLLDTTGAISPDEVFTDPKLKACTNRVQSQVSDLMRARLEERQRRLDKINDVLDAVERQGCSEGGRISEEDWSRRYDAALAAANLQGETDRAPPNGDESNW